MTAAPLVLELDLHRPLVTTPATDPLTALRDRNRTQLADVVEGLRRAATDPKVAAVIARCDSGSHPVPVAQEVRSAIRAFRTSGKPAIAWAESFGELTPGTVGYYIATAFDEIWLQPSGDVSLTGLTASAIFLREALDRFGIRPELGQRHEYKNAPDMFTRTGFSPAHREALGRIVESTAGQMVDGIADSRHLEPARVRDLVDNGPTSAERARESGLIDHIGYRDEVYAALAARVGNRMRLRYVGRYNQSQGKADAIRAAFPRRRGTIALVHGHGPVVSGRSSASPFGAATMGSETVTAALRSASRDESVRAVIFAVDSPGGSYIASDTIRRQVLLTRRHKPVIVSMGMLAGSGGYFVSMPADVIVATPATITGSIGVVAGKLVQRDLLTRFGVHIDRVDAGEQAGMFAAEQPYTDRQWEILDDWLDRVYADFIDKVAKDRGLSTEHVHDVARGRIWTGADALEHGLVDELGGLDTAVRLARIRGGLPHRDDHADVHIYPKVPFVERLKPSENSQSPATATTSLRPWGSWTQLAMALGLPAAGPLTMPLWHGVDVS